MWCGKPRPQKNMAKVQKAKKRSKGQKLRDEKSMQSLDRAIAEGGYKISAVSAPPPVKEEGWKDAFKSMDALAKNSTTKPHRSRKIDPGTLANLLSGIDSINVDGSQQKKAPDASKVGSNEPVQTKLASNTPRRADAPKLSVLDIEI